MPKEETNPCAGLDLRVDQDRLPEQWADQPALMLEYGLLLADAEQAVDEAKARLAVVAADAENDIRNNPQDYDITKLTEATVAAAIPLQPAHQIATKKYNTARHDARIYRAAVDALGHRKSALQGMTDLYMRQWFADPKTREQPPAAANTKTISRRVPRRPAKD